MERRRALFWTMCRALRLFAGSSDRSGERMQLAWRSAGNGSALDSAPESRVTLAYFGFRPPHPRRRYLKQPSRARRNTGASRLRLRGDQLAPRKQRPAKLISCRALSHPSGSRSTLCLYRAPCPVIPALAGTVPSTRMGPHAVAIATAMNLPCSGATVLNCAKCTRPEGEVQQRHAQLPDNSMSV